MPDPITFPTTTAMAMPGPRARSRVGWLGAGDSDCGVKDMGSDGRGGRAWPKLPALAILLRIRRQAGSLPRGGRSAEPADQKLFAPADALPLPPLPAAATGL